MIKVLQVLSYPNTGGASKACLRLHQSFMDGGVQSKVLMLADDDENAHVYNYYRHFEDRLSSENLFKKVVRKINYVVGISQERRVEKIRKRQRRIGKSKSSNEVITFSTSNYDITTHPAYQWADLIHLHWVSGGFINYESFFRRNKKPVVWTLHDMNPFTGGCHFSAGCEAFRIACSDCHFFDDSISKELIEHEFVRKHKALRSFKGLHVVSPSNFLLNYSNSSKILGKFPHSHIPYGIDAHVFKLRDKADVRKRLGLPVEKKMLLFVAAHNIYHRRKGLNYLIEALRGMKQRPVVCTVGPEPDSMQNEMEINHLGMISEESKLAEIYSAADLFAAPSIEDNLPNTVLESLMSGTPVVAFNIGGMPDMVKDGKNGFLVDHISAVSLQAGIEKALKTSFDREMISKESHRKFSLETQSDKYEKVYRQMLDSI